MHLIADSKYLQCVQKKTPTCIFFDISKENFRLLRKFQGMFWEILVKLSV